MSANSGRGHLVWRAGMFLVGAAMVLAGVLKILSPNAAGLFLQSVFGLSMSLAVRVVLLLSFGQAIVGLSMALSPGRRVVRVVTVVTLSALAGLECVALASGADCGCYGDMPALPGVNVAVLLLGLVSVSRMRASADPRVPRASLWGHASGAAALLGLLAFGWNQDVRADDGSVLGYLQGDRDDGVALVGSWDCEHCRELVDAVLAADLELPMGGLPFVVSDASGAEMPVRFRGKLRVVVVPDRLWFGLLEKAPPAAVRWSAGGVQGLDLGEHPLEVLRGHLRHTAR